MAQALDGVRVLVVEDDFLVSLLLEDILAAAGCVVLGPVPRLADALDAAAKEECDVAVLERQSGGRMGLSGGGDFVGEKGARDLRYRPWVRCDTTTIRWGTAHRQAFLAGTAEPRDLDGRRERRRAPTRFIRTVLISDPAR